MRVSSRSMKLLRRNFTRAFSGRTLVIAHHHNVTLDASTLHSVTAAKALGNDISVLVAGSGCGDVAAEAAKINNVKHVYVADDEAFGHGVAENISNLIENLQADNSFSHIVAPASTVSKSFMPRVAAALDVAPISEVSEVVSEDTFVRPVYAGNVLAKVQSLDDVKLMTVRTTSFEAAETGAGTASVEKVATENADLGMTTWVSDDLTVSDRPSLTSAKVVISGGRGMKEGSNFAMLESIADKLGGAVGASRAAVDAGMVPNDYQVGQTGKVVAPDLYIAVGISGAIQHLAGMKDSKCIVAINKDAEAPIFQVSDYGLVADLFDAVPEMESKL